MNEYNDRRRFGDVRIDKLYEDIYTGRGKENPSVISRIEVLEEKVDKITENFDKLESLMLKVAWGVLASIILAFGNLILKAIFK
jgi:hypothetical protein